MNLRPRERRSVRQALPGFILIFFLAFAAYSLGLLQPSVSLRELIARANGTRISIALTSNALMGPFPTATGPTRPPSLTPTTTPTPTSTPSPTSSPTAVRYFSSTATPRPPGPPSDLHPTLIAPTIPPPQPTNPPQVTKPPRPTNPPGATNPPRPTNPPNSTRAPKPTKVPKPTKTPRK